jgi:hypothetical protein
MRTIITSLAIVSTLVAAGCNNGMDQQSATKVMSSALTGTAAAQAQFKPVTGQSNASVDATIQNPAGTGSAHVTGTAVDNNGTWTVNFDITYTNWSDLAQNVTLNGSLHETATFTTMVPLVGSVKITGDVAATGSVQGSADFDLGVSYSPTQYQVSGHVGGASLDVNVNI